jgi:hypothetical protein
LFLPLQSEHLPQHPILGLPYPLNPYSFFHMRDKIVPPYNTILFPYNKIVPPYNIIVPPYNTISKVYCCKF